MCYHAGIQPSQFHALFPRILTGNAQRFYIGYLDPDDDFFSQHMKMKTHFDTNVNKEHYYTDWTTASFVRMRRENPEMKLHDVLKKLLDKLQLCQRALGGTFAGNDQFRIVVIKACRGADELEHALYRPAPNCEQLFVDLRSSFETYMTRKESHSQMITDNQFLLDRKYTRNTKNKRFFGGSGSGCGGYNNKSGGTSRR